MSARKRERIVPEQLSCFEGAKRKELLDELTALQRNVSLPGILSRVRRWRALLL
jgi:hypothetical protein